MSTFAYRDADGQVVFSVDGMTTTFPSEDGDTPAHAALREWVAAGGEIQNTPVSSPPVLIVDMWRAKAVLKQTAYDPKTAKAEVRSIVSTATNLLDAAAMLVDASGNSALEAYWQYASTLTENDPALVSIADQLNISDKVHDLFVSAQAIKV